MSLLTIAVLGVFASNHDENLVIAIRIRQVSWVNRSLEKTRPVKQIFRANVATELLQCDDGGYAGFGRAYSPFHVLALPSNKKFQEEAEVAPEATSSRQIAIATILLKAGFDPTLRNAMGRTPLQVALTHGSDDLAVWLISNDFVNADEWTSPELEDLVPRVPRALGLVLQLSDPGEQTLNEIDSAFFVAVSHHDWETIEVLLQHYTPNKKMQISILETATNDGLVAERVASKLRQVRND